MTAVNTLHRAVSAGVKMKLSELCANRGVSEHGVVTRVCTELSCVRALQSCEH